MSRETLYSWIKVACALYGVLFACSFIKERRSKGEKKAARPSHELPLVLHWLKCCAGHPIICLALISLGGCY
ncbi:hypothetical protein [Streptomyces niger]|uniref:hypothetical protein n=1 Tax=Streptomyces niger TaxID=66373 RepID=UPI00069CB216|nr:hypothetical protein [Streptomyces niger]